MPFGGIGGIGSLEEWARKQNEAVEMDRGHFIGKATIGDGSKNKDFVKAEGIKAKNIAISGEMEAKRIAAKEAEANKIAATQAEARRISAEEMEANRIAAIEAEAKRIAAIEEQRINALQAQQLELAKKNDARNFALQAGQYNANQTTNQNTRGRSEAIQKAMNGKKLSGKDFTPFSMASARQSTVSNGLGI